MKTQIFIDMDGVVAKWNTNASIEDTYKPGYFLHRESEEKVVRLIQLLTENEYRIRILSAAYEEGTARADKNKWLLKHAVSAPAIFVPYGRNKSDYIDRNEKSILIDDFSKNLREWETAGNTGIKFYNGINGTKGTWDGYSIDHRMSTEKMYVIVKAVADSVS
jgi:5'(3')-deoxyribonucleotidase